MCCAYMYAQLYVFYLLYVYMEDACGHTCTPYWCSRVGSSWCLAHNIVSAQNTHFSSNKNKHIAICLYRMLPFSLKGMSDSMLNSLQACHRFIKQQEPNIALCLHRMLTLKHNKLTIALCLHRMLTFKATQTGHSILSRHDTHFSLQGRVRSQVSDRHLP